MYLNSTLLEGRQVVSISNIVCPGSLATVNPSYLLGKGGDPPTTTCESQFPGASQGPTLQTRLLRMAVSDLLSQLFSVQSHIEVGIGGRMIKESDEKRHWPTEENLISSAWRSQGMLHLPRHYLN